MDAVYVFRHSRFNDIEIRYSLRSIARHMPWVRKVWIFGDRPEFLTDDASLVQHVPHEYAARIGDFQTPVTNFFHMLFLFTRKRIFEAWCDFQDFTTQDRWFGMLGPTAILNHALKHDRFALTNIHDEGTRLGFWGQSPAYEEVVRAAPGKLFLNFDDAGYGEGICRFLAERFPAKSVYERTDMDDQAWKDSGKANARQSPWYPTVIMPNRDAFGEFLNQQGLDGEGVEVGVGRGGFTATILGKWHGKRLHGVDPWSEMSEDGKYVDIANVPQAQHEQNYQETQRRLHPFGDRCAIHRQTSRQAAAGFRDRSLDFVYLDARHYREALLEDLELWAPKIRPGGILAGHDYLDGTLPSGRFEVKTTVDQWAAARRLTVCCSGENVWRSWFIQIP